MEFVSLGNVVDIYLGITHTPEYVNEGIPFLSVKDISKGKIDFSNCKYISVDEFNSFPKGAKPQKGDVLFCRVGTIGKPIIIPDDVPPFGSFVSLGFLRLKTNKWNPKFIKYWMESDLFWEQVKKNTKGASQVNLNTNWLKKFIIPNHSIETQNKIVDKLDKITNLIAINNLNLENLDNIVKSQFIEMFGNINSGEFKYEKIMLKDVCEKKSSNLQINKLEDNDGIYPLYGASGLVKTIDFYCSDSDYLGVVKDGSGVGKIFFLEKQSSLVGTMEYIYPNDKITIRFLEYSMKNLDLADSVSGVAIPHIYFKNYSKKYISLPPKDMQLKFENLINQIDKSKFIIYYPINFLYEFLTLD